MLNILSFLSLRWQGLSVSMLLVITVLSLVPLPELPELTGSDKTHHLIAYCLLMLPVAVRRPPAWKWFGLGFIAWSGLIELIQPYVNRYGEWMDLLANASGVLCAILLAQAVFRFIPHSNLNNAE